MRQESKMNIEDLKNKYNKEKEIPPNNSLEQLKNKYAPTPVETQPEVDGGGVLDSLRTVNTHIEDLFQGALQGVAGALKETTKTIGGEDTNTPISDWIIENTGQLETPTGHISEGITKFAAFYAGPGRIFAPFKAAGTLGVVGNATVRGAATDAFTLGREDQRLSETLKGYDWDNSLIDYLASPSENQYEDKFKHATEGAILGLGLEAAVISTKGLFHFYKYLKDSLKATGKTEEEIKQTLVALSESDALSHSNIVNTVEDLKLKDAEAIKTAEALKNVAETEEVPFSKLPKELRGATPKFKKENIKFANDFEKALYIMGNVKNPSKRQPEYIAFALAESGMAKEDLLVMSKLMRGEVIAASKQGREVDFTKITKLEKRVTKSGAEEGTPVSPVSPEEATPTNALKPEEASTVEITASTVEDLMEALTGPPITGTKPPETAINYERTSFGGLEEGTAKRLIEASANTSSVQGNALTKKGAKKILKTETVKEVLTKGAANVAELAERDVAVRTLLSSAGNTLGKVLKGAEGPDAILEKLLESPEALFMFKDTADVAQEMGTQIARALQSRNVNIDSKSVIKTVQTIAPLLNKAKEASNIIKEGGEVIPLLNKEEMSELQKALEELLTLTSGKEHPLHGLETLNPNDGRVRKMWNFLTEIKLVGQLSAFTTQQAASLGTGIKRISYKMENRIAYALGAVLKDSDRLKWNEVNAMNATEFKKAAGTLSLMRDMLKSIPDSNLRAEDVLQRTAIDGFISKLDETTSQAAITKEYLLPNMNPDSIMGNFLGGVVDSVGAVNRLPVIMLSLQDDAAKRMFYLPHINYLAITEGNKKGLVGKDLTEYVAKVGKTYELFYMKRGNREFEIMKALSAAQKEAKIAKLDGEDLEDYLVTAKENAEAKLAFTASEEADVKQYIKPDWHEAALAVGRDMTFQTPLAGDSVANKIIQTIADAREIHPTVKWVLPYYKTIVNMTTEVARRTPLLHKFSQTMEADMKAGGRRKRMAQAKLIQGSAMYVLGYNLVSQGYITPTSDKDNYQVMKDAGVSPASLQLPWMDKPLPLNRIEPVGTYLLMMAELDKANTNVRRMDIDIKDATEVADKMGEVAGLYSAAFASVFVNKTMMDSVDQFVKALDDPDSTYWANLAVTATVPSSNFFKQFTQEHGDVLKEAKTFGEVYTKAIGQDLATRLGLSDGEPLRDELNIFGKPAGSINKYYGFRTQEINDNDVLEELVKVGASTKKITKSLASIGIAAELKPKDHYKLQEFVREADLEGNLTTLFASESYRSARIGYDSRSVGTKKYLINEVVKGVHNTARELFKARSPEYIDEIVEGRAQVLKEMQNNISEDTSKSYNKFFEAQNN